MGKQPTERRLADNEAMAVGRTLRIGSQKLNLVAESIRGHSVEDALSQLAFSKRRIAGDVRKIVQSAVANAENNHDLDVDRLYIAEATVGRAMVLKRWRPRARGRTAQILKPFSNLTVIVREREEPL